MRIASSGQNLGKTLLEDCRGIVPGGCIRFGTETIIRTTAEIVNKMKAASFAGTAKAGGRESPCMRLLPSRPLWTG